ncbi:MAG TPA: hypothetical protein VGN34_30150 [Ktedonobacteraceae bacterium]|jgi:hypothetical protein
MEETFQMLGELPPAEIAQKLREIGDDEAAEFYEQQAARGPSFIPEGRFIPHKWLDTAHQHGFIPLVEPGLERYHNIISATNMPPDASLLDQRVNIRLDWLRAYDYPRSFLNNEDNIHTILFTFEAKNQVEGGSEPLAFNQSYYARTGQDAAVVGHPIFIGLTIGPNGIGFAGETVNVSNSSDEQLVAAITSEAAQSGLSLLTTAQPALTPFVSLAKKLSVSLIHRRKNVGVQRFSLGLDFDSGATGARLAIGSYVVVQASGITWSDWCYDADSNTICSSSDKRKMIPYNTIIFRVSKYHG